MRPCEWPAPGRLSGPLQGDSVARSRATQWPAPGRLYIEYVSRNSTRESIPHQKTYLKLGRAFGGLVDVARSGPVALRRGVALGGGRNRATFCRGGECFLSRGCAAGRGSERGRSVSATLWAAQPAPTPPGSAAPPLPHGEADEVKP